MRLGAVIPCADEWRFMPAVLGQVLKVAEHVIVVRNHRAFSGELRDFGEIPVPLSLYGGRVVLLEGDWPSEHETRNAGLDALEDSGYFEYVLTLDSDEVFLDDDMQLLAELCGRGVAPAVGAMPVTYWKTPEWRVDPHEVLVAVVAVRRGVRFHHLRQVGFGKTHLAARPGFSPLRFHHISYVRTDEEVREKLRNFAHAAEVRPGWFEDVWKRWDGNHALEDIHPVTPACYKRAVRADGEIARVLTAYGCNS